MIARTLSRMQHDGLITLRDVAAGGTADIRSTDTHTIGYELEVLSRIDAFGSSSFKEAFDAGHDPIGSVTRAMEPYNYGVDVHGEYELQSPPANHPLPLTIATNGIVRAGWLPQVPMYEVTAHISVGTGSNLLKIHDSNAIQGRLINLLRAVDLTGGSTADRLMAPVLQAESEEDESTSDYSWAQRGCLGIRILSGRWADNWHGDTNRIEFRTGSYQSPDQFRTMLERIYFLTRGMFEENPSSRIICNQFDLWLRDYQGDYGLFHITEDDKEIFARDGFKETGTARSYLEPYANHFESTDVAELEKKLAYTVMELAEEFGLADTLAVNQGKALEESAA